MEGTVEFPWKRTVRTEYFLFEGLLRSKETSEAALAAALRYFSRVFLASSTLPAFFDISMIDCLIEIFRDSNCDMKLRYEAAIIMGNIKLIDESLTHIIIEKGALSVFVHCLESESDPMMHAACFFSIGNLSRNCLDAREAARRMNVLHKICELVPLDFMEDDDMAHNALQCSANVLRGSRIGLQPEVVRHLTTLATRFIVLHRSNSSVQELGLNTISHLVSYASGPPNMHLLTEIIDYILRQSAMPLVMKAANIRNPSSLLLIGKLIRGSELLRSSPAHYAQLGIDCIFVETLSQFLSSTTGDAQKCVMFTLTILAEGPPSTVDLLIENDILMLKIVDLLPLADEELSYRIYLLLTHTLASLNATPRPALKSHFLGYGMVPLIKYGSQPDADTDIVNQIKPAVRDALVGNPEFWRLVKSAGDDGVRLLPVPFHRRIVSAEYHMVSEDGEL